MFQTRINEILKQIFLSIFLCLLSLSSERKSKFEDNRIKTSIFLILQESVLKVHNQDYVWLNIK